MSNTAFDITLVPRKPKGGVSVSISIGQGPAAVALRDRIRAVCRKHRLPMQRVAYAMLAKCLDDLGA